jgi:hypothetical protein
MKRFLSVHWGVASLCAALATIVGCPPKDTDDKPPEIKWQGQDTGYQGTTMPPHKDAASDPTTSHDH